MLNTVAVGEVSSAAASMLFTALLRFKAVIPAEPSEVHHGREACSKAEHLAGPVNER